MSKSTSPPQGGGASAEGIRRPRRARRLGFGVFLSLLATAAVSAFAAAGASAASTITGSVTVPAGVSSHDLRALLLDSDGSRVAAVTVIAGTPTSTGTYTFDNVENGNYKIYFVDRTGADDVQPAYYGGATAFSAASTITVTADEALAAVTLGSGGAISGTITDPNVGAVSASIDACLVGSPDPGQSVFWNSFIDGQLCSAGTVSGNTYSIGGLVPGDTYELLYSFGDSSQGWSDSVYVAGAAVTLDQGLATTVTAVAGSVTTANFTVPTVGSVTGAVTDPSGVANTSVSIDLFDSAGTEVSGNETFANGTYTVNGVLPGSYKVEFVPSSTLLAPQYYNDSATLAAATAVTVNSGAATTAINATLAGAATVSGTVTAAQGGADLGGIEVDAVDASGNLVASTFTSANGSYTLTGLPAGTWYLRFDGGQAFNGLYYTTEYYGGSATLAGSVAVSLTSAEALVDANQALMAASTVRPGPPTVSGGRLSGLSTDKVALSFKLTAGSGTAGYLESFRIKLPKNVSWNKKNIGKYLVIAHDTYKETITKGQLVVTFPTGKKTVSVQIKGGGITVTKAIQKLATARKIGSYAIDVSATDTTGLTTALSYTVKKPH